MGIRLPLRRGAAVLAVGVCVSLVSVAGAAAAPSSWSELPLFGGDVSHVAVDPSNGSHLLAATYGGGVFSSSDGGAHWVLSNRGFSGTGSNQVFAVAFDATGNVYAATNRGLWKSTNGGGLWSEKSSGITTSFITTVAVDPSSPGTVFAGTTNGGVFKSTDAAGSWAPVNTGLTDGFISALVVDPASPSTVYAGTGSGVGKTTDGGGGWSMVNTGLANTTIGSLAIDPANHQVLYAGMAFSAGVAKTTTGGTSWGTVNNGLTDTNVHSLLVFGGAVYAGTDFGLFKSTDGASSWNESDNGLDFANVIGLTGAGSTIYAGTGNQGIFDTTNAGANWSQINNGLVNVNVSQVQVDPTIPPYGVNVPEAIYAQAGEFNDIYKSVNGGPFTITPENGLPFGINPGTLQEDKGSPQTLLVGTRPVAGSGGGLYESTDGGDTWAPLALGSGSQPNVTVLSNVDAGTFVAGSGSTAYVFDAFNDDSSDTQPGTITAVVAVQGVDTVVARDTGATPSIRLYLRADHAWENFSNTGLDGSGAITAFDYKLIKGSPTPVLYAAQGTKIFRYSSQTDSWVDTLVGSIADAEALADPPGSLYAGTYGTGVWLNTNPASGGTWSAMNSGLGNLYVNTLATFPGSSYVIAGTAGGGVWAFGSLPPRTAFTDPSTLTGAVHAKFSLPVENVTSSNFALRVTGTTANLAGAITCKNGTAVVSCATGPVTIAMLQPTAALVPGQHYTALVNPTGVSSQITDAVGDPADASTSAFRASRNEQETSAAARYAWRTVSVSSADGGSYTVERSAGASASFSFTGTSVSWITVDGPAMGEANVYIDGMLEGTFNQYAATTTYNVAHTFSGLASGNHTITIKVLGVKGSSSATDSRVALDAFQIGSTLYSTPAAIYAWQLTSASGASGSHFADSDLAGTSVVFKFRGTAISWYTVRGPNQGKANVYIDGTLKGTFDNYATTTTYGTSRSFTGLTDALHNLIITTLGTKQTASTGTLVSIDRWSVT